MLGISSLLLSLFCLELQPKGGVTHIHGRSFLLNALWKHGHRHTLGDARFSQADSAEDPSQSVPWIWASLADMPLFRLTLQGCCRMWRSFSLLAYLLCIFCDELLVNIFGPLSCFFFSYFKCVLNNSPSPTAPQSTDCLFILLGVFCTTDILVLIKSSLSSLRFLECDFYVILKSHCQSQSLNFVLVTF